MFIEFICPFVNLVYSQSLFILCLNKKNMVLKEAENVIKNHINQIEHKNKIINIKKFEKKYKFLKLFTFLLFAINIFCILNLF